MKAPKGRQSISFRRTSLAFRSICRVPSATYKIAGVYRFLDVNNMPIDSTVDEK